MNNNVVIIDYGMGNLFSNRKVIERLGHACVVSSSASVIHNAKRIILPGVGHFEMAMNNLIARGLVDVLNEAVLIKKIPVLGICLGMQLMARYSEEGDASGLNWLDARVVRFQIQHQKMYKVPHVGWNTLKHAKPSRLLQGISPEEEFYFVHSYHFQAEMDADVVSKTTYEHPFVSAVERDNIYGVQFHPEKSHKSGERLIKNFLNS